MKTYNYLLFFLKSIFYFSICSIRVFSLGEINELYSSPQGLAMGNALTADARGYAALFYNPSALAKEQLNRPEFIPFAIEGYLSTGGILTIFSKKSLGIYRLFDEIQKNPGRHSYFRYNLVPAISRRNFAFAILGSYWYQARSDGIEVDIDAGTDIVPTLGYGINLAGNLIKLGVSVKAVLRNQLKGIYAHADLNSDDSIESLMKEGIGYGADIGCIITLPIKFLPTLGLIVKDFFDVTFNHSNILNKKSSLKPDSIGKSANAALSFHPYFSNKLRSTIAIEIKHFELWYLPIRKKLHIGFELENTRNLYVWAGLNQLYFTFGIGYRIFGGNFEFGTYGVDIGEGPASEESRRFFFRYTISF